MIRRSAAVLLLASALAGSASHAQELALPVNAVAVHDETVDADSLLVATGPWTETGLPSETPTGALRITAWRIAAAGLTTQQIAGPLRSQLEAAGAEILFACESSTCGGFDFRFAVPVLPPPRMQVNLGDFRYLSARHDGAGEPVWTVILVSRTAQSGWVQISRVSPHELPAPVANTVGTTLRASQAMPGTGLSDKLENAGHAILDGLTFETGSAQLGEGPFPALQELADLLAARPQLQIALVGHTDSAGSLDGNIALSRRRAGSVLERMVTLYGVPRRQMEAQGMGYLSPVASNLTEEGREANRRVEVIVTGGN